MLFDKIRVALYGLPLDLCRKHIAAVFATHASIFDNAPQFGVFTGKVPQYAFCGIGVTLFAVTVIMVSNFINEKDGFLCLTYEQYQQA